MIILTDIQNAILENLLNSLKLQSEAYLNIIKDTELTHEQRKDFDREISDINRVLNELSQNVSNVTTKELELLKNEFNEKLLDLNDLIQNLNINTLKIEFDSLTPEQKEFLKGSKGDKGDKGENGLKGDKGDKGDRGETGATGETGQTGAIGLSAYQVALNTGFVGSQEDFIISLKGEKGEKGEIGATGESIYQLAIKNGFVGTETDYLNSLKSSQTVDLTLESLLTASGVNGGLNGLVLYLKDELIKLGFSTGEAETITYKKINNLAFSDYKTSDLITPDFQNYVNDFTSISPYNKSLLFLINLNHILKTVIDENSINRMLALKFGLSNIYPVTQQDSNFEFQYLGLNIIDMLFMNPTAILNEIDIKFAYDNLLEYYIKIKPMLNINSTFEEFKTAFKDMMTGSVNFMQLYIPFQFVGYIPFSSLKLNIKSLTFEAFEDGTNQFFNLVSTNSVFNMMTFTNFFQQISNDLALMQKYNNLAFDRFSSLDSINDTNYNIMLDEIADLNNSVSKYNNLYSQFIRKHISGIASDNPVQYFQNLVI